jgi:hypothetical protein
MQNRVIMPCGEVQGKGNQILALEPEILKWKEMYGNK